MWYTSLIISQPHLKKLSSAENFLFLSYLFQKKQVDLSLMLFFASMIVTCPGMEGVQKHTYFILNLSL